MRLNLEALLILDALDRHGSFAAAAAVGVINVTLLS